MHGRRIAHARGKVLGGSSSINGMIFQRGNPLDYERWAAEPGMQTWDYAHCLPYFKRMETCLAGADEWRGGDGPLVLERGPATNPLFDAFFAAAVQAGYLRTDDVNGYRQEGFAKFDRNICRGRRLSAARAYLHPVMHRRNLTVRTLARATSVKFEGGGPRRRVRADGTRSPHGARRRGDPLRRRRQHTAVPAALRRRKRRICSSPLASKSSPTCRASAPTCRTISRSTSSSPTRLPVSVDPGISWPRKLAVGAQWLVGRSGLGATNHFEGGGFCRSNADVDYPNLMFHFLPMAVRYDGSKPAAGHGYQVHVGPMYSDARGWIRIRSNDPRATSCDRSSITCRRTRIGANG